MRLLLLGDCHFRSSAPARRTDDFFQTQLDKMEQVKKIYVEQRCDAVLQAGDLFDSGTGKLEGVTGTKVVYVIATAWAEQFVRMMLLLLVSVGRLLLPRRVA